MRDVEQEPALAVLAAGQRGGEPVERAGDVRHLGRALRRQDDVAPARGEPPRRGGERRERAGELAGEEQPGERATGEAEQQRDEEPPPGRRERCGRVGERLGEEDDGVTGRPALDHPGPAVRAPQVRGVPPSRTAATSAARSGAGSPPPPATRSSSPTTVIVICRVASCRRTVLSPAGKPVARTRRSSSLAATVSASRPSAARAVSSTPCR